MRYIHQSLLFLVGYVLFVQATYAENLCHLDAAVLSAQSLTVDFSQKSQDSIVTNGIVSIEAGVTGILNAPVIQLSNGFHAKTGSNLRITASSVQCPAGFASISDDAWDETAVRQVLHIFAYGGHAKESQITAWAAMIPALAIQEMLTFNPVNLKLSPAESDVLGVKADGTLLSLANFWSSDDPDNILPTVFRKNYIIKNFYRSNCYDGDYYHSGNFESAWIHAVLAKGSNPFLHKIAFWETNYHMVANNGVNGVSFWHLLKHYDTIITSLVQGDDYADTLGKGALDLAIGLQYGHINDYWITGSGGRNGNYIDNDTFHGNEDFAREFHQLFFGVLGTTEHDYHENVTIKNTAKALTDIRHVQLDISAQCDFVNVRGWPDKAVFGTEYHHADSLEMYHQVIGGVNAEEKIRALARLAIQQEESLDNLPLKIIAGLADDRLTPEKIAQIQAAWREMPQKNLLEFLRAYAISNTFHRSDRLKYHTSFDRNLIIANLLDVDNSELHRIRDANTHSLWSFPQDISWGAFGKEGVEPFKPIHDVFGHQRGDEAVNSPDILRSVYNRSTETWNFNFTVIRESGNWEHVLWAKDLTRLISQNSQNQYSVKHVAEFLWQRLVADDLANFGTLERAHLYALLSNNGLDLGWQFKESGLVTDENHIFTRQELIGDSAFKAKIDTWAGELVPIDSTDLTIQALSNEKINRALTFLAATPYVFIQKGR